MSTSSRILTALGIEAINLQEDRRRRLSVLVRLVVLAHLIAVACSVAAAMAIQKWVGKEYIDGIVLTLHILSLGAFLIGMLILLLTGLNEALARETLDAAKRTSRSDTHKFTEFSTHINWLHEHLSPEQHKSPTTDVFMSVSTPLYGIAAGPEEAIRFLEYFESWIKRLEALPTNNPDKPRFRLACWNADSNVTKFQKAVQTNLAKAEAKGVMRRFESQLQRLHRIGLDRKADVHLNYSDQNDSRIFMIADSKNNNYAGIMVVFSPITNSSIKNHKWHLIGVSFVDHQGYDNVHYIFEQLQQQDYEEVSSNRIDELANPRAWLLKQYQLPEHELFGTEP